MKLKPSENILQQELDKFYDFCTQNRLVINSKKLLNVSGVEYKIVEEFFLEWSVVELN